MERRTSQRLKNIPVDKRPSYVPTPINLLIPSPKVTSACRPRKINSSLNASLNIIEELNEPKLENKPENGFCNETTQIDNSEEITSNQELERAAEMTEGDKGAYARVKKTLQIYNSRYLRLVQENQKATAEGVPKVLKRKKTKAGEEVDKRTVNRFDLSATSEMRVAKEILYPQKRIGHLPGVDVGFQFYSRAEMVAVGFHSHWLNGIDCMSTEYENLEEYKCYKFPLAVSIVMSGQYEDDVDNLEDVWYTGQGGNDLNASKQQYKDQTLTGGNLALKNNMDLSVPVRVIRGNKSGNKDCSRIYVYDGLYKVVECLAEKGASGFKVYKFRIKREPDQPKLTSDQVHFMRAHKPYSSKKFHGLVSFDIASGKEGIRICAINTIDNTPPTGFTYTSSMQVAEGIILPANAEGCKCEGNCTDEKSCACAKLNGNEFPYVVSHKIGRLMKPKDVVYECGPNCGCGPDCVNRISQQKMKYKLEVFKTQEKGWAVRTSDFIPAGAPVCEYIGVLRKTEDVDHDWGNDYFFEIDCQHTMKGVGGRQRRALDAPSPISAQADINENESDDSYVDPDYCIDAGPLGNVSRFINHSCEPNLFVQCILSSHHDPKLARIVLVANAHISPFEELTYDYGYALNSVSGPDGNVIELPCHCGDDNCRKRLF